MAIFAALSLAACGSSSDHTTSTATATAGPVTIATCLKDQHLKILRDDPDFTRAVDQDHGGQAQVQRFATTRAAAKNARQLDPSIDAEQGGRYVAIYNSGDATLRAAVGTCLQTVP